jgi:hypothetical protein
VPVRGSGPISTRAWHTEGQLGGYMNQVTTDTSAPGRSSAAMMILGVSIVAVAGQIITNVYPVLIGALSSSGRATPAQLGRLAMVEYLSMALTSLFAEKVLRRIRPRVLVISAGVVQVLAAIATMYCSGDMLLPARAVFAGACGVYLWVQYQFVALSPKPGRLVGICTSVVSGVAILMSWIGSVYVGPKYGVSGLLLFFAIPSVLAILLALNMPNEYIAAAAPQAHRNTGSGPISWGSRRVLASGLIFSAWISILWVYSEPMSKTIGISEAASQAFIVATLAGGLIGAGLGAIFSEKVPFGRTLTFALLVCVAHVVALLSGVGSTAFVIWFGIFGIANYLPIPFYVKAMISTDGARAVHGIVLRRIGRISRRIGPRPGVYHCCHRLPLDRHGHCASETAEAMRSSC